MDLASIGHFASNRIYSRSKMAETELHIELPIYESVRECQLQHGLKYDDHRQYRSYCSRRLHRIRRSLNVHQSIPSTAKARHQRARKLMDVSNTMVLEAGEKKDDYAQRMLIIPLCLAERAWSYAMQLKQEVAEYPRKRFHLVRRLKKAAEFATKFEKLVHDPESPCSERTKKEATAYAAYMNGLYNMEREQWAEAKDNFNNSLFLYTALSLSVKNEQMIEQYRLRIEELRASLRYCTFTLGEKPKDFEIKLPDTLRFHDIAFRHAKQVQDDEPKPLPPKVVAKQSKPLEQQQPKVPQSPPQKQAAPQRKRKQTTEEMDVDESNKQQKQQSQKPTQTEEEDDDDEFEEAVDAGDGEISEDETSEEEESQPSGGVTGLVKGWLGGAWSGR